MVKKIDDTLKVLEMHTNLDLEGYEDVNQDGEETGIKLTLHCNNLQKDNQTEILSIRRNYQANRSLNEKENRLLCTI